MMETAEWIINRTCIEKRSFTLEEANIIVDKKASKGQVVYYYKCPFCCRYHMSKQGGAEQKLEIM